VKAALIVLIVTLAGCGRPADHQHSMLMERGCVFKSRGVVGKTCGRGGCGDIIGTIYSCPAYEAKVDD